MTIYLLIYIPIGFKFKILRHSLKYPIQSRAATSEAMAEVNIIIISAEIENSDENSKLKWNL